MCVCVCVWVRVCVCAHASAQPKIFQGKEGRAFVELGHSDKHFIKNTRKSSPQGNILEFFLLDNFKTKFWMGNLN